MTDGFGTLNDQAAALLRVRILKGELAPGSRILEAELAGELGLSRGTLRVALQQLGHEGLIVQKRFHSTFVTSLSSRDAFEIYTLRNCLEAMAAQQAAERIDAAGISAVGAAMDILASAVERGDTQSVVEADFGFHRCVMRLSCHSKLQEHYRVIEHQTRLYLQMTARLGYELHEIIQVHRDLALAIQAGDSSVAVRLAQNHNTTDGERMVECLKVQERSAEQNASE